jgi:hypothetical protein
VCHLQRYGVTVRGNVTCVYPSYRVELSISFYACCMSISFLNLIVVKVSQFVSCYVLDLDPPLPSHRPYTPSPTPNKTVPLQCKVYPSRCSTASLNMSRLVFCLWGDGESVGGQEGALLAHISVHGTVAR